MNIAVPVMALVNDDGSFVGLDIIRLPCPSRHQIIVPHTIGTLVVYAMRFCPGCTAIDL